MSDSTSLSKLQRLLSSGEPLLQRTATDAEYEALARFLSRTPPSRLARQPGLFLIFVGLLMRREVLRKGRSLWQEVGDRLDRKEFTPGAALYDAIERELLRHGIPVIETTSRRFVETFWREVGITRAHVQDLLDLFHWYYKEHYPDRPFSPILFDQWPKADDFAKLRFLMAEAIKNLIFILEVLQAPDCPMFEEADAGSPLRQFLWERLGFDPFRVLPSESAIQNFYMSTLRMTTPQKLRQFARSKKSAEFIIPDGRKKWGHELAAWEDLPLGLYVTGGQTLNVSLHPKVPVDKIVSWTHQELVYPFQGYVGYYSKTSFKVLIDGEPTRPSLLYRNRLAEGHAYLARIPIGRQLEIDGHRVPPREGVEWGPVLKLWHPSFRDNTPPRLYVDISSLRIYRDNLQGVEIEVTCKDQKEEGRVDSSGLVWLRNLTFDLNGTEDSIALKVTAVGTELTTREIAIKDAMLFAEANGSQVSEKRIISPGSWFYLFTRMPLQQANLEGGRTEQTWVWGDFHVYRIRRTEGRFSVKQEHEWELFEKEFFTLTLDRSETTSSDPDLENVYDDISTWLVRGQLNLTAKQVQARIELLRAGRLIRANRTAVRLEQGFGSHQAFVLDYRILPESIMPGEYLLRITIQDRTAMARFILVPKLRAIHGEELTYCEGDTMIMTAEWDNGQRADVQATAEVEPMGSRDSIRLSPRAMRIPLRLHTLGVTDFPFVFPLTFSPHVFGFRFVQRILDENGKEREVGLRFPCREDLLTGLLLYCFGRPGVELHLKTPADQLNRQFGNTGDLHIELRPIAEVLTGWRTHFQLLSEELRTEFSVVWRPKVSKLEAVRIGGAVRFCITGSGPADVSLRVGVTDLYGRVCAEQLLPANGYEQTWEGTLVTTYRKQLYLRVGYTDPEQQIFVPLNGGERLAEPLVPLGFGVGASCSRMTVQALRLCKKQL